MARQQTIDGLSWRTRVRREAGQSLVESLLVIMLLCLVFFGFLQVGVLYNHERVLQFASFAAVRSASVGFNQTIYTRAYKVAGIPASGSNTFIHVSPRDQLAYEIVTIPLYLNDAADMDYTYWERYNMQPTMTPQGVDTIAESHAQEHPLDLPFVGAYYPVNSQGQTVLTLMQDIQTTMAAHYKHYLQ